FFFFQAEDGIRDFHVTGVQTCALPICAGPKGTPEEQEAWASMSAAEQDAVNRVYANIGKAIGAFERSILPGETRFDRFARAVARSEERRVGQKGELGGRRSREQHRAEG